MGDAALGQGKEKRNRQENMQLKDMIEQKKPQFPSGICMHAYT